MPLRRRTDETLTYVASSATAPTPFANKVGWTVLIVQGYEKATAGVDSALRTCYAALNSAIDKRRFKHYSDSNATWMLLVAAVGEFTTMLRASDEAPERMLVLLKNIIAGALPREQFAEDFGELVITFAIESYFKPAV